MLTHCLGLCCYWWWFIELGVYSNKHVLCLTSNIITVITVRTALHLLRLKYIINKVTYLRFLDYTVNRNTVYNKELSYF